MEIEIRKMYEHIQELEKNGKLKSFHIWLYKNMIDLYSQKIQYQTDIKEKN